MIVVFLGFLKNFLFIKLYKALPRLDDRGKLPEILTESVMNPNRIGNET